MLKQSQKEYILVFLLLFFSGNPFVSFLFGKFATLVFFIFILLITSCRLRIKNDFKKIYLKILLYILGVSFFQFLEFNFVSFLGIFNLLLKILCGSFVIYYLGSRFSMVFLRVLYHLSIISLFSYFLINIVRINLPFISLDDFRESYVLHVAITRELIRNCGMFWEPGAFAGVITLCAVLNFNSLKKIWISHKKVLIVITTALVSTLSTTGYLVGLALLLFYFLRESNFFIVMFIVPLIFIFGFFIYDEVDFMKEKIENQFESSKEQGVGEFSNTRFGSLVFDWHYIQKHPIIGNGLHESTRYADHQFLFLGEGDKDVIGSGNAFSNNMASMGVFFVFGYFYLIWKRTENENIYFSLVVFIVILFNLQGEQWLNFPLYLGLPFLFFKDDKKTNLSKNKRAASLSV